MNAAERLKKMHDDVEEMNVMLPELHETLPRNDYYRLKQLLEELESILKRYANG
ncbi:MAG: hypothetical protein KGH60_00540 [Candidatus Micrarchaeota archaeon]|nr:hypothetical protein [Candidatus Micrarchaeota archaeon]